MDGVCILQTSMVFFEIFPEESQTRGVKTCTGVGNCMQAEDETGEGCISPLSSSVVGKRRAQPTVCAGRSSFQMFRSFSESPDL